MTHFFLWTCAAHGLRCRRTLAVFCSGTVEEFVAKSRGTHRPDKSFVRRRHPIVIGSVEVRGKWAPA